MNKKNLEIHIVNLKSDIKLVELKLFKEINGLNRVETIKQYKAFLTQLYFFLADADRHKKT